MNLRIKTLRNVFFFLIRLGKDQFSSGNKFPHKSAKASEPINFDSL